MNGLEVNKKKNEIKVIDDNGNEFVMESYLVEYYNECRSGNIIVGNELMTMLENLIEDLEDEKYDYDTFDAEIRIDFVETFCKHTKSPFYGMPFILELWQKALIEALYSFKDIETGFRRFRKCLLLVARKNGKSTLCAALALAELNLNTGGVDIICSSNDDKQAGIIFDEINNMRMQFDPKGRRTHKNMQGIFQTVKNCTIKKLSDRTLNKEGYNIDFAIIDEVHEMIKNSIVKPIEQSQSTKDEPLMVEISTEGFVIDGYLDKRLKYARKILDRSIEDIRTLVWLYTQDSENEIWQDKTTHSKSNPNLGVTKKESYIEDQILLAQNAKEDRVYMLAKDFNIKMNDAEAWLLPEEYENEETFTMESFRGSMGIGGVDLAETTDLVSARIMIMKPGSTKKYFIQKYFIPEGKVEKGEEEDKKNYLQWAREGLIEVTPGNENDFSLITKWFYEYLFKQFNIRAVWVGYDNALAKYWVKEMEETGFEMVRIPQKVESMSEPAKLLAEDLRSGYIVYNNNPIDIWCLSNTAIKVDSLGRIMLIKVNDNRYRRIDGSISSVICEAVYIQNRSEYLQYVR